MSWHSLSKWGLGPTGEALGQTEGSFGFVLS